MRGRAATAPVVARLLFLARSLRSRAGMSHSSKDFQPPHCPRPSCPNHAKRAGWRYRKHGFYRRQAAPHRVQRFLCLSCGVAFSRQSFQVTYWLKRPDLLGAVFWGSLNCSSFRQLARQHDVAHSTIARQTARLGRHCLLFNYWHRPRKLPDEALVVDGFESFEYSQYHPFHFNLAVAADSHFFLGFTHAPLRRKGRMTAPQKKRRGELEQELGRPDPKAIEKSMAGLLEELIGPGTERIVRSDEHPAYPRALRRLKGRLIRHEQTPSKAARTTRNPLFPVNLLDLLIRHGGANQKRETIAFSKRLQGAIYRLAILQTWRNFMKRFSEKDPRSRTPAQRLGLRTRPVPLGGVLARRLFASRVGLPGWLGNYYRSEIPTAAIPGGRRHELAYAF